MSLSRYALGLILTGVAVGPLVAAARRIRARMLPDWGGAEGLVAEVVLVVAMCVAVLELSGVAGVMSTPVVVAGCALAGLAAWAAADRIPEARAEAAGRPPARPAGRVPASVACLAVGALAAAWGARVVDAYRHGMSTPDTVWYHLPTAARYVQTGSILPLHYVDAGPVTAFYPANAELVHSFGLLLFGSDLVSPLIDTAWAAVALLAAWAIGRRLGRGPHCLTAAALVLGTPTLVSTQPGGAYNDVVVIALLLCAAASLLAGGLRPRAVAVAALAAGLALGTKYTAIVPVGILALGALTLSPRGTRRRQLGIWACALLALAGVWYARNAARSGSPLAPLGFHLGPLSLPAPSVAQRSFAVVTDLFDGGIWTGIFIPGLRQAFGPADWAMVGLAFAGALLAAARGRAPAVRLLGIVSVAGAIGFLFTPQYLGTPRAPVFFVFNLRYLAGALTLGLVLLPLQRVFDRPRWSAALLAVLVAVLIGTEIDPAVWPTGLHLQPFSVPPGSRALLAGALIGAGVGGAGLLWCWWAGDGGRPAAVTDRLSVFLALPAALVVAAGGWLVADAYARDRYSATMPYPTIFRWAQQLHGARIGIGGSFYSQFQYPLYGRDDSNYVQYIGVPEPHAGFEVAPTCSLYRRTVNQARFRWLVLATASNELRWTSSSPSVALVMREPIGTGELFRVDRPLDPARCPGR